MDDLLDLDWDKKPTLQTGSQQKSTLAPLRNGNYSSYSFDALTRSLPQTQQQAATPINRSGNGTPTNLASKPQHQQHTQGNGASNSDAFSSLLGFDATSNNKVSMAERLKKDQEEKLGFSTSQSLKSRQPMKADNSAWEGLDSLMSGSKPQTVTAKTTLNQSKKPTSYNADDDLWAFAKETSSAPVRPDPPIAPTKPAERKVEPTSSKGKKVADPFDFSEFEDPGDSQSSALGGDEVFGAPPSRPTQPRFMENSDDEDDILGSLGSNKVSVPRVRSEESSRTTTAAPKKQMRSVSPPPHIIGQIVEMGFSPAQARKALAATDSGLDVSAAIEMLVGEAGGSSQQQSRDEQDARMDSDRRAAIRLQREEERGLRQEGRAPARRRDVEEGRETQTTKTSGLDIPPEWQKQADQIYTQASEIGASMFSKANAFWSTAKAQAQRAIDERNQAGNTDSAQSSGRSSPSAASDRAKSRRWAVGTRDGGASQRKEWQGKPKWMIDAENEAQAEGEDAEKGEASSKGGFKDDNDDDSVPQAAPFFERKESVERLPPSSSSSSSSKRKPGTASADIWEEASGVSMAAPVAATARKSSPLARATAGSNRTTPSPAPRRANNEVKTQREKEEKLHRQLIQDSPAAIQASSEHKLRGNELFKRGAYGEAEVAYSSGLSALEGNMASLRRIALLNNRASARLKNGDARSALADTKDVLTLIVVGENKRASPFLLYRPSKEHALPLPEYAEINLREAYAKAMLKRAQAEEMLEQWDTAKSVWSLLEKYEKEEGSGKSCMTNMRAAQDGIKRCNKMLRGEDIELNEPAKKRVHAAATKAIAKAEAMAKERIRAENAIAVAEETEKDNLRDSVESRVLNWKSGKENNVRALLASLENVVWPGLNWKKVGMHEVVMDNQVKRVYMRAIGKLHPDKLTPKANTIEERMIGGAVFSVLNDAWSSANSS